MPLPTTNIPIQKSILQTVFHRPHYVHTTHAYSTSSLYEHNSPDMLALMGLEIKPSFEYPKGSAKCDSDLKWIKFFLIHYFTGCYRTYASDRPSLNKHTHAHIHAHTHTYTKECKVWICGVMYIEYKCELWSRSMSNDRVRTVSPLYRLHHRSPIWIIHMYVLCTSLHILQIIIHNFWYFLLIAILCNYSTWILTKTVWYLNCAVIRAHFTYICILFSPSWRWPHKWPKHVGDHNGGKIHP